MDYNEALTTPNEEPFCDCQFLFSMNSYDHLKGVAERKNLINSSEYGLVNPIPQAKDLPDFGQRIKFALSEVSIFSRSGYAHSCLLDNL